MKKAHSGGIGKSEEVQKNLIEKYTDILPVRLLIQNIPYIGTSLDTVLAETGNKWREKRLQTLLQKIDEKLKALEILDGNLVSVMQKKVNTEEFYDLFLQAGQKSTMTHNTEKIEHFANILKNYLINDISSENYLIEVFLDITSELTDVEAKRLSELQENDIEVYYTFNNRPFDIERYKNDISEQRIPIEQYIPKAYEYDNLFMYSFNRLERLDLIKIETVVNAGGYFSVGWSNGNQSENSSKQYKTKDIISISELGKKYIDWGLK
jgi:hypothetical protein